MSCINQTSSPLLVGDRDRIGQGGGGSNEGGGSLNISSVYYPAEMKISGN